MWRIIGLPWPSSRMKLVNKNHKVLTKNIVSSLKEPKKPTTDKYKTFDKVLGVEFPSSRFN